MYSIFNTRISKTRVRPGKYLLFSVAAVFFILSIGNTVDAWQALDDADRRAVMDQEMDCITKNMNSNGEISWDSTCSSQYSSRSYRVTRFDDADKYSQPSSSFYQARDEVDTPWEDAYKYSKYAADDEDIYEPKEIHYKYKDRPTSGRLLQVDLRLLGGYRVDDFKFNIASDETGLATPNILSELTWTDLKMTQLRAEADVILKNHFIFEGMASYADIYDGKNQDSDYTGDDRTLEWCRSDNKTDDGEAFDWSLGAGYRLYIGSEEKFLLADDIWLTLLGGYSSHELTLVTTEGFQTIPPNGPFAALQSYYWAEWDGPWLGFELDGSMDKLFGSFRFEYHWADFYGSADWNLASRFRHPKSFDHTADGRGLVFNFGAGYHLSDDLTLDFEADIQDWETGKGIYRPFFSDGTTRAIQLNEVNWNSKSFMFGSTYQF